MRIHVEADAGLSCHRCLGPLLLTVEVPVEGWTNCHRTVGLCQQCDGDSVAGRELVMLLTREQLSYDDMEGLATLLREWVEHLTPADVDEEYLDRVLEQWSRDSGCAG